ncbi:UDP-N-acetylglucosamine 1-carboxyvinyltransferase [Alkaliphilus sp. MSJ-5]|uniref:UDP-N-acetylglucosamine 1-carboxyvinyltransferase n=1 Tax=Alkaliphilus flagellatus TaxID=2841507 RepID=A0ABS6G2L4_9FIRM|nr:UDP-N-acetylglucosamine 1-carboxyvinyltransferase [Alkaliphilus flagellatus]MBU5676604.1 UDP-N-acetylglucosamine 1-carboxyvinyltransferase [Alkaliphilus flagellatus]
MSKIIVQKSRPLQGTVRVSGAKNAVLPILAATLLSTEKCVLEEVPALRDVDVICEVLSSLGADIKRLERDKIEVMAHDIDEIEAPYELVRKMRASFLVMGPLLARMGKARISMPGGCAIGTRPIDLHLKGFKALGAEITLGYGFVEATAERLIGSKIYLDFPSVGATENIMMAAVLAEGQTVIENAAEEPEITDLANFLNKMGADIKGAGTDTIKINGVENLGGAVHSVIPDRIEAGTYMIAAAITGGNVLVDNVVPDHLKPVIAKLKECNMEVMEEGNGIRVIGKNRPKAVDIKTMPYPGFPTDMQSQFMALMSVAEGTSIVIETVFENRFMHVSELKRMGADIKIEGRSAIIEGKEALLGAPVKATDLRAGAALILSGLVSDGITEITNTYHIDRGYVDIEEKLRSLGANIYREENLEEEEELA